ncbi:sensor histidine kinase [Kitasatospora nipponensis]
MRIWHRISVRTRAAVGAALASVLAFGLATYWVGQGAYDQWLPTAQGLALNDATSLESALDFQQVLVDYRHSPYVLVLADGTWAAHDGLEESPSQPGFLPPLAQDVPVGYAEMVRIHLPSDAYDRTGPVSASATGRTATFLRRSGGMVLSSDQLAALTARRSIYPSDITQRGRQGLTPQRVTTYVLVDTTEARAATDRVTRELGWYLTPAASLFVAAVAWLVTGLALRPVESIRRRMAAIGEGAFHERVPVPPSRDGIARLAGTTNVTLDRLERALTEQRRLVADASHELRSPLAALRSALEVPLIHPQQADWPGIVRGALLDTERLQELADDLLLLARTEEAVGEGTVDLHDLATEQLAERAHTHPHLTFTADLTGAPSTVHGREVLVGRLLRNLLDNASRYAASTVRLTLTTADGWTLLTVTDDGPGIPTADRDRVFDRFVRLDTDRDRRTGGAGLGLALVRTIARSLGGTATATASPTGTGAHLVIRLPSGTP